MGKIKNICVHHTGGLGSNPLASTQSLSARDIDNAHKARWNMKSGVNHYGGYNFFIDLLGNVTQMRSIGEETMAQRGHNFDTVSICLAGNFTKGVDMPTPVQRGELKNLMIGLLEGKHNWGIHPGTKVKIRWGNIFSHRQLQPGHTICYGNALKDNWAKVIIISYLKNKLAGYQMLLPLYITLLQLLQKLERLKPKKLGANDRSCEGFI